MKYYFVTFIVHNQLENTIIGCTDLFDPIKFIYDIREKYKDDRISILFYHEVDQKIGMKYAADLMIRDILNEPR